MQASLLLVACAVHVSLHGLCGLYCAQNDEIALYASCSGRKNDGG